MCNTYLRCRRIVYSLHMLRDSCSGLGNNSSCDRAAQRPNRAERRPNTNTDYRSPLSPVISSEVGPAFFLRVYLYFFLFRWFSFERQVLYLSSSLLVFVIIIILRKLVTEPTVLS
ncbi:unnamed protein product [Ectocarpus sp. 6 AP-2014]